MKIELTPAQEDQVVIKSLKRDIRLADESDVVCVLLLVLEYYLAPSEFDTFVRKNNL